MSRIMRTSVRVGLAAGAVTGLVLTGLSNAQAVPAAPAASSSSTPTLHVAVTDRSFYVDGPTTFPAGRVNVTFDNAMAKHEGETEVFKLASGYHWSDLRSDFKTMATNLFAPHGNHKKGLKSLNHLIDHITAYGGFDVVAGKSTHGTLLLPTAGTYVIFNDSNSPRQPHWLTVTSPVGPTTLPSSDATVVAKTNRRFGGDTTLPANGTITFHNESTESPHFLALQQVKPGTTRKQVIQALQGNGPGPFLAGVAGSDAVSGGQSMNLHVHIPAGTYAEMCFFPDPKTGMPHALMGMVRIVHVK
jgi:hypothetical protein